MASTHSVRTLTYSVRDLCKHYEVGGHTVLAWIHRGDLKAVNVSRNPGGRPKWRITQAALDAFEALRTHTPPPPRPRRRHRREDI
jgi:hypothetical protein